MLTRCMFVSPNKGRRIGNAIPTPIAGDPDIAPINRGTTMAIAITGIPEAITASNSFTIEPDVVIMSLR